MLSILKPKTESNYSPLTENLQEVLSELLRYGRPRLGYYDTGWHCHVEMNTNTQGSEFNIRSEFGINSPIVAAKQCHERILSTLKTLNK